MHDCIIHLGDDIETFSLSPCLGQVDCTLKNDSSGNWDQWEKCSKIKKEGQIERGKNIKPINNIGEKMERMMDKWLMVNWKIQSFVINFKIVPLFVV